MDSEWLTSSHYPGHPLLFLASTSLLPLDLVTSPSYDSLRKWYEDRWTSSSNTIVAPIGNSFIDISHSLGPWIRDIDHSIVNKSTFSSLCIHNVLCVSRLSLFLVHQSSYTWSHDCVISLTKDFVSLQDDNIGQIIGLHETTTFLCC